MNWKKLLLVAVVAGGFAFAAAPRSEGGVSVGIGLGFPGFGYGYYPYAAPAYYPYGYNYGYYAPGVTVAVRPRYYWSHGHRVYYPRHYRHAYRYWR